MIPAVLGLTAWIARGVAVAAIPRLLKVATELFSPPPQSATPEPCAPIMDNQAVFSFSDRCIVFEWDDDGRMTAIVNGTHRSEFGYDGYGRRIKIAEFDNGVITSKKLYWWLGGEIVTEREGLTAGFPLTKQYFGQGVIANGVKLFYTWDQLGSVRELIDSAGVVRADYRYDTYGKRTKETGDLDSDWGYAGLWHHGPSGLDLATFRTYDSAQGRWISRDPLGEAAELNLYAYCGNNPVGAVDPSGLYGYIYGTNGNLIGTAQTPQQLLDFLLDPNLGDGSIGAIRIFGHGNESSIGFDTNDHHVKNGTLFAADGKVQLNFSPRGPGTDITDLLKKKLAPKGRLTLAGCSTKDLAQAASRILKGRQVLGGKGFVLLGNQWQFRGTLSQFVNGDPAGDYVSGGIYNAPGANAP